MVPEQQASPSSGRGEAQNRPPVAARRILIVDDNVDAAESLGELLKACGQEVRVAFDGEHGVYAAQDFQPDVVILDIGLPVLDGYEVARRIRSDQRMQSALLIALSGYEEDLTRKAPEFDCHFVKPLDFQKLTALLENRPT